MDEQTRIAAYARWQKKKEKKEKAIAAAVAKGDVMEAMRLHDVRVYNALVEAGVDGNTLLGLQESQILRMPGLGRKTIRRIEEIKKMFGVRDFYEVGNAMATLLAEIGGEEGARLAREWEMATK